MVNKMGITNRLVPIFALVLVATLVIPSPYTISSSSVQSQSSFPHESSLQKTINSASNFIKNGIPAIPSAYAAPTFAINPTSGPAPTTITLTGSGFTPNTQFTEIFSDTIGDVVQYVPNLTFTTDPSGNILPGTTFPIPAVIPLLNVPLPCGSGTFIVESTSPPSSASAPFTVTACSPTPTLSMIPATGTGQVTFTTNGNGGFTSIAAVSQSSLTPSPPAGSYPYGFFNWSVSGFTGSSVTITITYPNPVPPGTQYEKLVGGTWVSVPITISGNTITMTITDNGPYDADPAVGTISDPGGILVPSSGFNELQVGDTNGACETIGGTFISGNNTCRLATNLNLSSGNSLSIDSGVTLTVTDIGSITNSCNSSCTTTLSGFITNSGTIYNEGTIDYNTINNTILSNIINHGNIDSASYFSNIYNNGTITNNPDGTITNNQGTVLYNLARGTIDNYGTITDSVADSVTIYNYNMINNHHGGTIANYFHFVNQPGATITNNGAIIIYGGALYQSGTINNNADGWIDNLTGCCINNSPSGIISGTGNFNSTLEAISNDGTITDPVVIYKDDNPPTYTINYPVVVPPYVTLTVNSGNVLTINSGQTVSNYGNISINNSATINNSGTINDYCYSTFTNNGSLVGTITYLCSSLAQSSATGQGPVTFTTSSGGFSGSVTAIPQSSLSTPPPAGSYPFGFFSWTISGIPVGGSTTVCMTYPSDPGTVYEKLIGNTWVQIPVSETTNPDGSVTVCMTLTDGATGQDADQTANGQITDPGAMGTVNVIPAKITGGGTIGKYANFGLEANSDGKNTKGEVEYHDKNGKIDLHSTNLTAVSGNSDLTQATIQGNAKVGDKSGFTFQVKVTDPDKKGTHDTFSIMIKDGNGNMVYQNSGTVKGHIEIHKASPR